jgi:DUF438 domain-containing protein
MKEVDKEKFLEEHGWERYGSTNWVKKEWKDEPERLKLEAHLCPHWYYSESLDEAYTTAVKEFSEEILKEKNALDTIKILERILLDAISGKDFSDIRSAAKAFARKNIYQWYLCECNSINHIPNPFIVKDLE